MATLAQLLSQRSTAGARYAAAVTELRAAAIDLAALDGALNNSNVRVAAEPVRTFVGLPDSLPQPLRHPDFAPFPGSPNWLDAVQTARTAYIAGFTPGA